MPRARTGVSYAWTRRDFLLTTTHRDNFLFRPYAQRGPKNCERDLGGLREMSCHALDQRIPASSPCPLRSLNRIRKVSTLSLITVLCLLGGLNPPRLSAATNEGQAQATTGQASPQPYFGYPPNSVRKNYSKEEAKAIGRVESAFSKYARACVELFRPEFIGLKGTPSVTAEILETQGWGGAEGLLDPGSLAGAISEASLVMSLPDSELRDWQRQIKRELQAQLPDYWNMAPKDLAEAAKEAEKDYAQDAAKAASHAGDSDTPTHFLTGFVLARRLYAIRLAELWQRPETSQDPYVLDYVQSLLRDGKPPNLAHTPREIADGGGPVTFVLFTPSSDTVTELSTLDTPALSSGKRNDRRQRTSAIRMEVVIAARKGKEFEFARYFVFKRVNDDYTPKDGPPFADLAFADIRWVMPLSSEDHITWEAGRASIKKNDSFPFQDEMVVRLAPENPYLFANYRRGAALGPAEADEPRLTLADVLQQVDARRKEAVKRSQSIASTKLGTASSVAVVTTPAVSTPPAVPVPPKPATEIKPILITDALFTIPGTSPIGQGLIEDATQNVDKAAQWINPLIREAKGPWLELMSYQPRDPGSGVIRIRFVVSPKPASATQAPQLVMSKTATNLSLGIPAEHYQEAGLIFGDLLELFVWNLPSGQDPATHAALVQQVRKSAGEFRYAGDPLPPEALAKLGVGTTSRAKSLDADTPDTGNSTSIYDGDIQGRVIGSTIKCFNFLLSKGTPYLARVQKLALRKAKESAAAGDPEAAKYWREVAASLGQDINAINTLLASLPAQLKLDFYIRPPDPPPVRGRAPRPPKIPESEPGVRISIALAKEDYDQGPSAVKEAVIQQLSSLPGNADQTSGAAIRQAINDFFLLFGQDPGNKGDYFAVTMKQLNPQRDETVAIASRLWPPQAVE